MRAGSALTEADVAVLDCLVDGDEPTAHVVDMLSDDGTEQPARGEVERRLSVLEARGLVSRSRAWGADATRDLYEDDWWEVTEAGWWALAISGAYSEERDEVLAGDGPPVRRAVALLLVAGPRTVAELTDALRAAWGEPGGEPADVAGLAPGALASEIDHARIQHLVQRRVGHLALDGVVAPNRASRPQAPIRWRLTDKGHAAVAGDTDGP
jgi:DNA-binding transcriptional ArsR family regulator